MWQPSSSCRLPFHQKRLQTMVKKGLPIFLSVLQLVWVTNSILSFQFMPPRPLWYSFAALFFFNRRHSWCLACLVHHIISLSLSLSLSPLFVPPRYSFLLLSLLLLVVLLLPEKQPRLTSLQFRLCAVLLFSSQERVLGCWFGIFQQPPHPFPAGVCRARGSCLYVFGCWICA